MRRFRLVIATLVAVAMMAFGVAACTPEQQQQAAELPVAIIAGLWEFLELDLFLHVYGDPGPPPTSTPTTDPTPTTTPADAT